MSREIKFRAWDKKYRRMRTPDAIFEWKPYYYDDLNGEIYEKDSILMQYTWLKDKNWKEIYEWDLLYRDLTNYFIVKYCDSWFYPFFDDWSWEASYSLDMTEMVVSWNIFENADLLDNIWQILITQK